MDSATPEHVAGEPLELHAQLREAILRGKLMPRAELSQVQLAGDYGVGRTPLREALRMLQSEGLVESERNRRMRVAAISLSDMEQLYTARIALEAPAVRLTVGRMDSGDIGRLKGDLAQMQHFAELADYEQWEIPHRAFHARLVSRAGDRLVRMIGELADHCERYRRLYAATRQPRAWTAGVVEHEEIVETCAAHDGDAAGARIALHLAFVARSVIELVDPSYETSSLDTVVAIAGTQIERHKLPNGGEPAPDPINESDPDEHQ